MATIEGSAYLQINRTKINVPNINVLQINGSLHQQKLVEVLKKMPSKNALLINGSLHQHVVDLKTIFHSFCSTGQ
jgi:hypothetical protein